MLASDKITNHWQRELAALGFVRDRKRGTYRLDGVLFTFDGAWSALQTEPLAVPADPLQGQLGKPGLWKLVRDPGSGRVVRLFDFPPPPASDPDESDEPDEENHAPSPSWLNWALATAADRVPEEWPPPPRRTVEGWIAPGGLTVQAGHLLRQCELIHRPDRLALSCPLLARIPADLPASRRTWLHEVLVDAQNRWRMVRIGLAGDGREEAVRAEVDFSGCPSAALEHLFPTGLGALCWVVAWLVNSVDFLADATQASAALEVCSPRALAPA